MSSRNGESPAGKVLDEAVELAIAEESPYPEKSLFINEDMPGKDKEMERAAGEGYSVVLVASDGDIQVISPEDILDAR